MLGEAARKAREKLEEYREIKPYWMTRFRKRYDIVNFRNGYGRAAPRMRFVLKGIKIGFGNKSWGAPAVDAVYILELGERLPESEPGSEVTK